MVSMLYIEIILIAISLSMDAFSLAISISVSNFYKIRSNVYAVVVGIFHFIMPILGYLFRSVISFIVIIPPNIIFMSVIIFIIIGILIDDNKKLSSKILNPVIFAFTVSVDSFSIGISLERNILLLSCIIFSLTSYIFTMLGFKFGRIIDNNFHKYSKIIAITILTIVLLIKLI